MDEHLQALRRRIAAGDLEAESELRRAQHRAGVEPTWEELAGSQRWAEVVDLFARWFKVPLREQDGATPEQVARDEAGLALRFPSVLREWYRLAGLRMRDVVPSLGLDRTGPNRERAVPCIERDALTFVDAPDARWCVRLTDLGLDPAPLRSLLDAEGARVLGPPAGSLDEGFFAGALAYSLLTDLLGSYTCAVGRAVGDFTAEDGLAGARRALSIDYEPIVRAFGARSWQLGHATTPPPLALPGDGDTLILIQPRLAGPPGALMVARTKRSRERALALKRVNWYETRHRAGGAPGWARVPGRVGRSRRRPPHDDE